MGSLENVHTSEHEPRNFRKIFLKTCCFTQSGYIIAKTHKQFHTQIYTVPIIIPAETHTHKKNDNAIRVYCTGKERKYNWINMRKGRNYHPHYTNSYLKGEKYSYLSERKSIPKDYPKRRICIIFFPLSILPGEGMS